MTWQTIMSRFSRSEKLILIKITKPIQVMLILTYPTTHNWSHSQLWTMECIMSIVYVKYVFACHSVLANYVLKGEKIKMPLTFIFNIVTIWSRTLLWRRNWTHFNEVTANYGWHFENHKFGKPHLLYIMFAMLFITATIVYMNVKVVLLSIRNN